MRGPSYAWRLVIELTEICKSLLDAHGRTMSLADATALRKRLDGVIEAINTSEECEAP